MIAITVEEEEDIGKFKDYKPSESSDAASDVAKKEPSDSKPPKEEAAKESASQPEPKPEPTTSKASSAPPSEGRTFASPLAKKMAEDHNVRYINCKSSDYISLVDEIGPILEVGV